MLVTRFFVCGGVALAVLGVSISAQPPAPLFRYVKLVDGIIELGKPLGWAARYAITPRD